MKTISFKTMIIAAMASLLFFSACKKDNPAPPAPPAKTIVGTWDGLYGYGVNAPNAYWSFQVNKDGSFSVKSKENGTHDGKGTWKLTDKVFTATFNYDSNPTAFFITALVDVPTGVMAGQYALGAEDLVVGDFKMTRK